jgi:hypothetical protein
MDPLCALHLFYDGPERHCTGIGGAGRYRVMAAAAEERHLESVARRAAWSMAHRRHELAAAELQSELKRFRRMALACRDRQSPSR